jgi:hypothetical protein
MFELTKLYSETGFPEDEMSLGYGVSVYQESIGQSIVEYLVNFDFFVRVMENYGFVLASKEDTTKMGLPGGSAMFDTLFFEMESELKRGQRKYGDAIHMTQEEKTVSFLNRYFVFKKVRNVAAEKVTKLLEDYSSEKEGDEEKEEETQVETVAKKFIKKQKLNEKEKAKEKIDKPAKIRQIKDKSGNPVQITIGPAEILDVNKESVSPLPENDMVEVSIPVPDSSEDPIHLNPVVAVRGAIRTIRIPKKPI